MRVITPYYRTNSCLLRVLFRSCSLLAPWLGLRPAFFISSTSSISFLGAQALVDLLPAIPSPSLHTDVPLTIVHAFFRTILLCNVIPRVVAGHASPAVAASSYTLLLTAWVRVDIYPHLPSLIGSSDHGKRGSLPFQSILACAPDADRGGHPSGAASLRLDRN